MRSVRALLDGILDYAGLFPPSQLSLEAALEEYARYREHRHGWMLGRFVLPWSMLHSAPLAARVTLVCRGEQLALDGLTPNVESLEVAGSLAGAPPRFCFQELDWRGDFRNAMQALPAGVGVKLRTGGVTADLIPPAEVVAQFLWSAARLKLPVKFTAGLHHPFPEAGEHGFLNVFSAALAAYEYDAPTDVLESLLSEVTVRFTEDAFHAGRYVFPLEVLRRLRSASIISFGCCSFLEPVEYLESLKII
jgi:hypothetical protein